jgi:7,8-dihydropterin-6-yl-methyl-4-(beta-D-ribofuranosyl)aminobenzene 5'-phosphate synthase
MRLNVLVENMASGFYGAEHGLSYLIEQNGLQILFDTGHTALFIRNSKLLDIDLEKIDTVVLSHGHWDHGNGLEFLVNKRLVCHPDAFAQRFRKGSDKNIGLSLGKQELESKFEIQAHSSTFSLSDDIIFLGEIPRLTDFEATSTPYINEQGQPDWILDDSALAIIDGDELVIISGCAHSGICNIISYAQQVTGIGKVKAVFGGFHLKSENLQLNKTIDFFKDFPIKHLYPSHCTELPALVRFYENFRIKQLKAGMMIEL